METQVQTYLQTSEEILIDLRKILRAVHIHSRSMIKNYGLTSPQLLILREIERVENPTLGNIAKAVSLAPATLTGIIRRLETRGLLIREADTEDKRRMHVRLTEKSRDLIQKTPPPMQEKFMAALEDLASEERTCIRTALKTIVSLMGASNIDAGPILDAESLDDSSV